MKIIAGHLINTVFEMNIREFELNERKQTQMFAQKQWHLHVPKAIVIPSHAVKKHVAQPIAPR